MIYIIKKSGIYCITNILNDKKYIGQSKDVYNRWKNHKYALKNNKHYNSHLQNTYNLNGINCLNFIVLEECNIENIDKREEYWIKYYKTTNDKYGYNFESGGKKNQKISESTKIKIIKALTGRKCKESTKIKIGNANRGRKLSNERKKQISKEQKGRIPWNKGIPQSEEQKKQHSEFMTGKKRGPMSEETKKKIGKANKGRSTWNKGNKQNPEWIKKRMDSKKITLLKRKEI